MSSHEGAEGSRREEREGSRREELEALSSMSGGEKGRTLNVKL